MTLKIYTSQPPSVAPANTGIGRVIHAQWKHLPRYGVEFVADQEHADLRIAHANGTQIRDLDVLHCHGLYWTGDAGSGHYNNYNHKINSLIMADARRARAITVPSRWVAEPFKRDMRLEPIVIGHGIDIEEYTPFSGDRSQGFVLWNKNRREDVCNPLPAYLLAERGISVVSTFAPKDTLRIPSTLRLTGQLSHAEMQAVVQQAGIYLATTKETYGIGTLEAMAYAVPVLGYAHGGTADLVEHKVSGYLVEPGDTEGLLEGVEYIRSHWTELSQAARTVAERLTWDAAMQQYATLYTKVAAARAGETHGVSIVITNYNYGRYLHEAITSCLDQTLPAAEIIIVDDGSTDTSDSILAHYRRHSGIQVISQANAGVAAARNNGIAAATSPYIVCLDADDKLDPRYLASLVPALKRDRGLGVAYSGLGLLRDDKITLSGWPIPFDWDIQSKGGMPPGNCIPAGAMFRRSFWERAGGYKQEFAPAEDAEFWARGLSRGFGAMMVTPEPLFHYRIHEGSASRTKEWKPIDTWHPWMTDKDFPMAAPAKTPNLVRSYSAPLIAVLVSPAFLSGEMTEVYGQTFRDWEAVTRIEDARAPLVYTPKGPWTPTALTQALMMYVEFGEQTSGELRHRCTGKGTTMGTCCGGNKKAVDLAKQAREAMSRPLRAASVPDEPLPTVPEGAQTVRMEFTGLRSGTSTYERKDQRSGQRYRGGNNPSAKYIDALPEDVAWLQGTGDWRIVQRPAVPLPVPAPPIDEPVSAAPAPAELLESTAEPEAVPAGIVPEHLAELVAREESTNVKPAKTKRGRR